MPRGVFLVLGLLACAACSSGDADRDQRPGSDRQVQPGDSGPSAEAALPPADGAPAADGLDLLKGPDALPVADTASPTVDAAPPTVDAAGPAAGNETCAAAQPLPFNQGKAQVSGSTAAAKNDLSLPTPSCVKLPGSSLSYATPGNDLFYSVQLAAGQTYDIELDCASLKPKLPNCAFYVLSGCQSPGQSCLLGVVADSTVWPVASGKLTPSAAGTYVIAVDALGSQGGGFILTVK